jgi:eukaryotic-like serine/threonine-protein kinase
MNSEPAPVAGLQPLTPPTLERVLKFCLAKDPEDRWQSARDLRQELQWVAEGAAVAPSVGASHDSRLAWILAAVLLIALGGLAFLHLRETPPIPAAARFTIAPPEQTRIAPGPPWGSPLAVSPDGRRIVFVAVGKDGKPERKTRARHSGRPLASGSRSSRTTGSSASRSPEVRRRRCANAKRAAGAERGTGTT